MRLHPELAPELEINSDTRPMSKFLQMGISTTKLYIHNPTGCFFYSQIDPKSLSKFIKKYGPVIKSLKVLELSTHPYGKERTLLQGLVNLESLTAACEGIGVSDRETAENPQKVRRLYTQMAEKARAAVYPCKNINIPPDSLKNLKELRIAQKGYVQMNDLGNRMLHYVVFCPFLEHLAFPLNAKLSRSLIRIDESPDPVLALGSAFHILDDHLEWRLQEHPTKRQPKSLDLENFYDPELMYIFLNNLLGAIDFRKLLLRCTNQQVDMWGVQGMWFRLHQYHEPAAELKNPGIGKCVKGLVNLEKAACNFEMPELRSIWIRDVVFCEDLNFSPGETIPQWDNLEKLDILVDLNSEYVDFVSENQVVFNPVARFKSGTKRLFNLMFKNGRHENLTELGLKYCACIDGEDTVPAPVPKAEDIVKACPNLKKLTLKRWQGTNKALVELWKGLDKLEEVTLDTCRNLGNVAFVGMDVDKPVFCNLTSKLLLNCKNKINWNWTGINCLGLEFVELKKLSLLDLDKMPKITDTLFSKVLCRMPLTHFQITCKDEPLSNVIVL